MAHRRSLAGGHRAAEPTIASAATGICRGISLLDDRDLTYDILIYPKHLPAAAELVSRFTRQRFVLDHLAKPNIRAGELREWEKGIRALAKFPLVFCKLSGLVTEADWTRWTPDDIRPYRRLPSMFRRARWLALIVRVYRGRDYGQNSHHRGLHGRSVPERDGVMRWKTGPVLGPRNPP